MSSKVKWFLFVVAAGFSVGVLTVYFISANKTNSSESSLTTVPEKEVEASVEIKPVEKEVVKEEPKQALPDRLVLDVPFYSQAPFAVWDSLHKETCEEASLHMVRDYFRRKNQSLEAQDEALISFVNWQTDKGYKFDITVQQVVDTAEAFYGFSGHNIIDNPTINDIKKQIAAGRPVIVPAAGKKLANPYFTAPGPIYHMLVIKGYDKEGFITNDPGTRRGANFHYKYQNLMDAIHDWNPTDILSGAKRVLVYGG